MAPAGSSMRSLCSMNSAATTTSVPATAPMASAENDETNAQEPVMAARPANMPLHIMLRSGLPKRQPVYTQALTAPAALASIVLTATTAMRVSSADSVEPELNPNQPNASTN